MVQEKFNSVNDLLRQIMTVEKNEEQGRALKCILTARENLFITGRAGSGKSTFMRRVLPFIKAVVLAPTGIAALNAGGQTMHSFFCLKNVPYVPEIRSGMLVNKMDISNFVRKKMKCLDTIIIDEVSMVRADLLDEIADILRTSRKSKEPFGGVRLIMFGDMSQLPPVVSDADDPINDYYESRYFFSSKALRATGFKVLELSKVFRQGEQRFLDVLEDVRNGQMSDKTIEILRSRVVMPEDPESVIHICSTNREADAINKQSLKKVEAEEHRFNATIQGERPVAPCEDELVVKVGASVLITRNGDGYVNGSRGVVTNIDDDQIDVELYGGGEVEIQREVWEKMRYRVIDGRVVPEIIGRIVQFPIRLGYAITAHKSQGMTLDSVYVDMSNSFETGQVYTALSRCRSLDSLYLKGVPEPNRVCVSDNITGFWNKVRSNDGVIMPERIQDLASDMRKDKEKMYDFEKYEL